MSNDQPAETYTVTYTRPTPDPAEDKHLATTVQATSRTEAIDVAKTALPDDATITDARRTP